MKSSLIAPQNQSASEFILLKDIVVGLEKQNPAFYGKADLFGFQAYKNGTVIKFFSRTCIHEGAFPDNRKSGEIVRCPWHGRLHKPLLEVDLLISKIVAVRIKMDETGLLMAVK